MFLVLLLLVLHVQWIVDRFNHHFAGMLQMLMDTRLDATQQDYARTAQASGKALITLINEVLDQAKIESGRLELEAVPFDLCAILDDVLSLFSGKSRDEGIEVCFSLSKHCFFSHHFCTSSSFRPKKLSHTFYRVESLACATVPISTDGAKRIVVILPLLCPGFFMQPMNDLGHHGVSSTIYAHETLK